MTRHDPIGSIWRRWDLHFHTPASFDYQDNGLTPEFLADQLIAAGIEVVAVTDHHTMNIGFIRRMQQHRPDRLTVLPGIELRSDLGGSETVHYIGIFPEYKDVEELWNSLRGKLDITAERIAERRGDEGFYIPFQQGCDTIHELGGVVTVHAGRKSNSIEALTNAQVVKQAVKTDLARRCIDAYEVGNIADCPGYVETVFPEIGKRLPLLMCSDNHDAKDYAAKCPMWLRADPSFLGLLQVINEPDDRVFLGDQPPALKRALENPNGYVQAISFKRLGTAPGGHLWFDGDIPLNTGLVAVIGKKGSGKSALADVLGLLGNTRQSGKFSFLNGNRFLHKRQRLGQHFEAQCHWRSGPDAPVLLEHVIDGAAVETIKYIPQGFLEDVCTALQESSETQFDQELRDVIFSHVGESDRLGCTTLGDLIAYKTSEVDRLRETITAELKEVNRAIVSVMNKLKPDYRMQLSAQLDKRKRDLAAQKAIEPASPKEPTNDPSVQEQVAKIGEQLKEARTALGSAREDLKQLTEEIGSLSRSIATIDRLSQRIDNLERQFRSFREEASEDFEELGMQIETVAELKIDRKRLADIRQTNFDKRAKAQEEQDVTREGSLAHKEAFLAQSVLDLQGRLDEPNRLYQAAMDSRAAWLTRVAAIEGTEKDPETIKGIEARIAAIAKIPESLNALRGKRWVLAGELFQELMKLTDEYRLLYAPVQGFIDSHPQAQEQGALRFEATLAFEGLSDALFNLVSHAKRGSFHGEKEGQVVLRDLVAAADVTTPEGLQAFITGVEDRLNRDHRDAAKPAQIPEEQLKANARLEDVYDVLFGLSYLKPRFEITWQNKPLSQLSPGERGNLLLVFYLLIDKRNIPLVIDQPEENLDNETIATMLVPWVRAAADRRQVIIVTHNPNLAVVCDADQIVHATIDKSNGNKISYLTGSLENPAIIKRIVDVLEGTQPAFDKRDAKYEVLNLGL